MSDLIRQSVSWPYVHGARSYSRVTQLARSAGAETSDKAEETDRPQAKAETGKSEGASAARRGGVLDLSV
ncbi:hypothetical protein WV31_15850 [Magnetospirillum sp. ME-1]|uniref:hypothetical protein n=1 Tax=Magnetospirillum sp. ME-1 TaxID=1639348 RepID=UPI000A17C1FF|nr:hypothetical protein [Magnetospirillum sp. ME-1]ARJ67037.1 hypothetical protein WV31_15850 [Magnetospirillum sp. ME-1]